MAESVQKFTLVKWDGSVIECSRDSREEENRELFGLCLGGYGLFGIIYDVTLKVFLLFYFIFIKILILIYFFF